jgi:peptide/nickel transport system ATP-binding protein
MTDRIIDVAGLTVEVADGSHILRAASLSVSRGEVLGVVGESGSGKSTMALAMLGFSRPGCTVIDGSVVVCGEQMLGRATRDIRSLRGKLVSYVPQDPGGALNPSIRVGDQIHEMLRAHAPDRNSEEAVEEALARVSLPHDRSFRRRFPHQLSGGQQQRVVLATALVNRPPLIVLDEPTTGLDVVVQASVVKELQRLRDELDVAMIFVSHNLAVVSQLADRLVVMHEGSLVEEGAATSVLTSPAHAYTRRLIDAVTVRGATRTARDSQPGAGPVADEGAQQPLLSVRDLTVAYRSGGGTVVAADEVSFSVDVRETVALVGESGSGKTSIGRAVAGLVAPESGTIALEGAQLAARAGKRTREQLRRLQIVFQNPYESLNPRRTVLRSVMRPAVLLRQLSNAQAEREVRELLERVRLPARLADRYPGELSGGERQRVAVARALAAGPDLVVCDEITSALDVSVQASLLELLAELRASLGLALLFITHDLSIVEAIADSVVVLRSGTVREVGPPERVLHRPSDPYTQALVAAAPRLEIAPSAEPRI